MLRFPLYPTAPARTLCRLGGGAFLTVAVALPGAGAEHDCIDVNTASFDKLREIIHIDEHRAPKIIAKRPWQSVHDLRPRIDGIGPKRLADILEQGVACVDGDIGQRQPGERR